MSPVEQARIAEMLATGGWWLRRAGPAGEETKPRQCFTEGGLVHELGKAIALANYSAQVRGLRALNRETIATLPPPILDQINRLLDAREAKLAEQEKHQ